MSPLSDARGAILPQPANLDPSRRSLSCHDCRRPIPAGTVRCRSCFARVQHRAHLPVVQEAAR